MKELESYAERIRKVAPEIEVAAMRLNREGLLNDVVIVNEEFVFRFPKSAYASEHLQDELKILRLLKDYLTLEIPAPFYESEDCMAYRMIPGETLRRDVLLRLPEDELQGVADQLAQFFRELHGVPFGEIAGLELPTAKR
jgi:aminoglycoside 2''-phosphotransferase